MRDQAVFAQRLREALHNSALSLEECASALVERGTPVSGATLSYWSTGRSVPKRAGSLRAVSELERILDVPAGWLAGQVGTANPFGWAPGEVLPRHPDLSAAFEQLGVGLDRRVLVTLLRDRTVIGVDAVSRTFYLVVRADRPDATVLPWINEIPGGAVDWRMEPLADAGMMDVLSLSPLEGQSSRLLVSGLLLPGQLAKGQPAVVSHRLTFSWASPGDRLLMNSVHAPRPDGAGHLVQEVVFEAGIPQWVRYEHTPVSGGRAVPPRDLTPAREVQVTQRDAPAGRHVITWG
ncbi:hypothetical protein ACTQ49_08925 [Luteococcus sp. Sow4_B9]|uniref:hypothetical protein n=1 Tax=Luteococcus sp. Sow4_B9 TaxID=3438792 RepID=UPI003F960178